MVSENVGDTSRGVVLLHPHPLYGGNMQNDIVCSLERVLQSLNIATLKFNFRGAIQASHYMGPRGAVQDAILAVNYMKTNLGLSSLGVVGYSFGGSIALALSLYGIFDFTITLSASLQILFDACEFTSYHENITWPCLLFHGNQDKVVPIQDLYQISKLLGEKSEICIIEGEGHFYSHSLWKVEERLREYVISVWNN